MWFGRKKREREAVAEAVAEQARIEIVAHQEARAEVVKEAKEVNKKLNNLLEENGFTIQIFLAAGGKHSAERKNNAG